MPRKKLPPELKKVAVRVYIKQKDIELLGGVYKTQDFCQTSVDERILKYKRKAGLI
jgi:hypothetical protein